MTGLIACLGDGNETAEAVNTCLGKTIASAELIADPSSLLIRFTDETALRIWDDGQSCCETRYMTTEDDLANFTDVIFTGVEIVNGSEEEIDYETIEIQFLNIHTNLGTFQMATHNEHNGYYGGFFVVARIES